MSVFGRLFNLISTGVGITGFTYIGIYRRLVCFFDFGYYAVLLC